MTFLWIVLTLFIAAAAVLTLLLFSTVVAEVDTGRGSVRIGWSPLLAYTRPLPGTAGTSRLAVAGIPISLPRRKRQAVRKEKGKSSAEAVEARRKRQRKQARLLWNCLLEDDVRSALMRQFAQLPRRLWDAVEVIRWHSNVSLSDPALNGMLWGALAAVHWGPQSRVECNFVGRNEVRTEVRLYPHRAAKACLLFFLRLPYRAVFRQWRAS